MQPGPQSKSGPRITGPVPFSWVAQNTQHLPDMEGQAPYDPNDFVSEEKVRSTSRGGVIADR